MNNDLIIDQFDNIEEKVGYLIELCKNLVSQNTELKKKIQELEAANTSLSSCEAEYTEQKKIVQSRIDSILTKLSDLDELSDNT